MNDKLITLMLQESNDIESHGPEWEKVNTPEDLANSVLAWEYLTDQDILIPEVIETTHWLITRRSLPRGARGVMRNRSGLEVTVGRHLGTSWMAVGSSVNVWVAALPSRTPKDSHISYEKIHPFVDGNGRSGRMIYYWQLAKIGELNKSTIIYDKDRMDYYKWFTS